MKSMFIIVGILFAQFISFAANASSAPDYTSPYTRYRNQSIVRTDPRLKHLPNSSSKSNKCLQYMMGVCTMTEPANYGRLRYNNAQRNNKVDSTKKLGFQPAEYWSN